MVIKFQDYFTHYNESLLDEKGVIISTPEQADKIIKLLEWYRTLNSKKRDRARSDKSRTSYQNNIDRNNGDIARLKQIKKNME
ncbi:hypothetical protein LpeD_140 [Lactobacillus phage LpeD]|uniref:Uncharacterized protein n=1 Tax=Lactobacillus phage LpeD TaxID=2041210 RepID=A0A291I9P2_9CAUD|nr:hypothetical protein HWB32_gp078 [Lactobacillus phage LpeD]ATG86389.1 hypothetical protein LpeD_140 [Lactobacillus phage LpeD]